MEKTSIALSRCSIDINSIYLQNELLVLTNFSLIHSFFHNVEIENFSHFFISPSLLLRVSRPSRYNFIFCTYPIASVYLRKIIALRMQKCAQFQNEFIFLQVFFPAQIYLLGKRGESERFFRVRSANNV
jgi:hypothetical protein